MVGLSRKASSTTRSCHRRRRHQMVAVLSPNTGRENPQSEFSERFHNGKLGGEKLGKRSWGNLKTKQILLVAEYIFVFLSFHKNPSWIQSYFSFLTLRYNCSYDKIWVTVVHISEIKLGISKYILYSCFTEPF